MENYLQISRHIFSILISSIGEEPLKHLVTAGLVQGDGIGAWKLLCKEYESATNTFLRKMSYSVNEMSVFVFFEQGRNYVSQLPIDLDYETSCI